MCVSSLECCPAVSPGAAEVPITGLVPDDATIDPGRAGVTASGGWLHSAVLSVVDPVCLKAENGGMSGSSKPSGDDVLLEIVSSTAEDVECAGSEEAVVEGRARF